MNTSNEQMIIFANHVENYDGGDRGGVKIQKKKRVKTDL